MNFLWRKKWERVFPLFILILIGANILSWEALFYLRDNSLKVFFFNVGEGDAIFIETPQHHQIIIDGGPSDRILEKLGQEMPFYDRSIDLIILTHPEKDHLAGLISVLKSYKVDNIVFTGVKKDTLADKEWEKALISGKRRIIFARAGEKFISGKTILEILYPFQKLPRRIMKKGVNDTSVVSLLQYGKISFLFTGDISQKVERKLVDRYNFKINVLKVPHHGSKTATSDLFLRRINPEVAVISVGKNNKYGHPSSEVIERLEKLGIKILRTDKDGDILIKTKGFQIRIKSGKISLYERSRISYL